MSNRLTILYFSIILIIGIIVSCCGEVAESLSKGTFYSKEKPFTNDFIAQYNHAKKKQGNHIQSFANTPSGILFLTFRETPNLDESDGKAIPGLGLADQQGNTLLKNKYHGIGNPGFINENCVELRIGEKIGLYNYQTKKIIPPTYDIIYPSGVSEYVAIGQKGNIFFKLYHNGTSKKMASWEHIPNYAELLAKYPFNLKSNHFAKWISTYPLRNSKTNLKNVSVSFNIFIPSYMKRFHYEKIHSIATLMDDTEWDILSPDSLNVGIISYKPRSKGGISTITSFYRRFAFARGETRERRFLTTFSKTNKVLDCEELQGNTATKFIDNNLVEMKCQTSFLPSYKLFHHATQYSYFHIDPNGKISTDKRGLFPMASNVELNESYLSGYYIVEKRQNNNSVSYSHFKHLRNSDLEYIIYEIYARHGRKFRHKKWSTLFNDFDWYQAKYTNVWKFLTPLEKKNILFIIKYMKNNK
jgi:hypothetical protein